MGGGGGGGARGQNLENLVKVVFLCWSFLEVYIFATTYQKTFIVGPKVPYPTQPFPSLPYPTHPTPPHPTHSYPILPDTNLPHLPTLPFPTLTNPQDLKTSLRLFVRSWILCIFCFHICVFIAIKIKFKPNQPFPSLPYPTHPTPPNPLLPYPTRH